MLPTICLGAQRSFLRGGVSNNRLVDYSYLTYIFLCNAKSRFTRVKRDFCGLLASGI